MKITAINMDLVEKDSMKLIGQIILDDELVIKDVSLHQNQRGGFYVQFPVLIYSETKQKRRMVHPISASLYEHILSELIWHYEFERSKQ